MDLEMLPYTTGCVTLTYNVTFTCTGTSLPSYSYIVKLWFIYHDASITDAFVASFKVIGTN
jgi:hypothetical protein